MISQMVLSSKGFEANVACVRSFICVRSNVNQQVVRFREVSIAVLADMFFASLLPARSSLSQVAMESSRENVPFHTVVGLMLVRVVDGGRAAR
jgi:hypothetical protein